MNTPALIKQEFICDQSDQSKLYTPFRENKNKIFLLFHDLVILFLVNECLHPKAKYWHRVLIIKNFKKIYTKMIPKDS